SKSLWSANISDLKNMSPLGISNVSIPLSSFKGIDPDLVSTGSIDIDKKRNVIWLSVLAFGVKGQLFKFDLATKTFTPYELPEHLQSPVGIAIDEKGNLWFNEHIGNKIAKFNPTDGTLIEYWIPTQNSLWAPCTPNEKSCGISNTLQFSIGKNNQVWFSEWTENKLGMLNSSKPLSFVVDSNSKEFNVKRGQTIQVPMVVSSNQQVDLKMIASSTFTNTGNFGNSSFSFSQDSFSMKPG